MKLFMFPALVALVAASEVRVGSQIDITEVEPGYQSQLPEVYGLRNCGGAGRAIYLRYQTCRKNFTCQVPGDGVERPGEFKFVPSDNADALGLRINVVNDGTARNVFDRPLANSAVQAGKTYIVTTVDGAKEELKGQTITGQYILYRVEDGHVETCVEAEFEVV